VHGVSATKIADSPVWDVALLRTERRWSQYTTLANYRPQIGSGVFSGGYAHAGPIHWFYGRVTRYITHQTGAPLDWIEAESGITTGDSGGPIIDGNGHVVGILWGSDGQGHLSGVVCTRIWQEFGQWLQSSSAPAGEIDGGAGTSPDTGFSGNPAGAAADWAAKIEAIRAEWKAEFEAWKKVQATTDATLNATVEAKAEAAVNVQVQQYTGELDAFGNRMVALDGRVKKLEGEMVAVQEQLKTRPEKGDTGPQGPPGPPGPPGASETQPIGFVDRYMRLDPNGTHEYKGKRYSLAEEKTELVYPGQTRVTYLYPLIQGGTVPSGN